METENRDDRILLSRMEDLLEICKNQYRITHSEFLDLRRRSLVQSRMAQKFGHRGGFYGGYEDAERVIAVFLPDYTEEATPADHFAAEPEDNPLTVLRLTKKKGAPPLSHRDYLGSLMGLGIRREVTGDILVREDGADVIVLRSMAEYIINNLSQAGRSSLTVTAVPIEKIIVPEQEVREKNVSVASLRLDNVLGAAFGLSRAKSLDAVRSGIVFVNGTEIVKPDYSIHEGDKIVLRHRGRVIVRSTGGRTGKGRIHITLRVFR